MGIRAFVAELRRRKVFRVAAFYLAGGFVVAQAADIFLPGLSLPPWTVTLVLALLILGFPLAVILAWAFDVTPEGVVRTPALASASAVAVAADAEAPSAPNAPADAPSGASRPATGRPAAIQSIAVLPFADMSPGRDNEYFSDGLTEELLNSLARRGDLRVPARTSSFAFKGRNADIREIGRTLGVEAVLEGSVRKAGDRVRITAQLVDVSDGYHRWSRTYDRELSDIFAIQEEISSSIVNALGGTLARGDDGPAGPGTVDLEAYDLCFRGLHDFHRSVSGYSEERLLRALERFEEAIEKDSNCASAHAWHAIATVHLADDFRPPREVYPRARASAERAVELDPELAEAHAVLGAVHLFHDWDPAAAQRRLGQAIELNQNSSLARVYCSLAASAASRHEDAIREARLAVDVDPLSALASWGLGWALHRARAYDAAAAHARTRLDVDGGDAIALLQLGASRREQGRADEALASIRTAAELADDHPYYLAHLGLAAGRAGRRDEARSVVRRMEDRFATRYVPPSELAYPYIGLEDHDRAFAWLETALDHRDSMLIFLDAEPLFDPLRADPRFADLRAKVGLPG
jgi:TolB-like protein/Flp pilus assembly protein TadD